MRIVSTHFLRLNDTNITGIGQDKDNVRPVFTWVWSLVHKDPTATDQPNAQPTIVTPTTLMIVSFREKAMACIPSNAYVKNLLLVGYYSLFRNFKTVMVSSLFGRYFL